MTLRRALTIGVSLAVLTFTKTAGAIPLPLELFTEAQPRSFPTRIPRELNGKVNKWIHFFSVDDHDRFDRFLERGALYKNLVEDILIENGVPPELYYLAMIESGFSRGAKSNAQAVGVWQFIAPTARRYGLRVDREVDERLDIIRSTRAAALYLKDLKSEFGSWYLAMAAYNSGENRVRRAVRRGGTRNFWTLARHHKLPAETMDYIPKFQAAMRIGKDPERYGFDEQTYYKFPLLRTIRVSPRTHLLDVARKEGFSSTTILALNPHLLRARTPASHGYKIYLPRRRR